MPNLLSLNTYHYRRGGADIVYLDHDALFREMGWKTAVMAMRHPENQPSPWESFFVDEIEFGHEYTPWQKLAKSAKVVYSLEAQRKLERLLAVFDPDIAHAHSVYHHLSPSVLALLRSRGIPTVMTAHDFKLACPAYKMLNHRGICERCKSGNLLHLVRNRCIHGSLALSSLIFIESTVHRLLGIYKRSLDRIVVPSKFHRAKLVEWGWDPTKLDYVPNYVTTEHYLPQYEPGPYFLYVGRLAVEKGVGTFIRAAKEVGVQAWIVGSGPEKARLEKLADGGSQRIRFLGYQSGDRLKALVGKARAVVVPSECYENAPLSVLEALASGKPVIGARIGGIPEMVLEGETGYLFRSGDAHDLAACLARVQSMNSGRLGALGRSAREFVSEHFTESRYVDSMLELYSKLGIGT